MEAHIEGSTEIYKAERKGDVCKHCKQDGDRLIIFFDNHNFVEGRLLMELTIEYPDPDYSEDGIRQEHFVEIAPIQIVADNGDALDLRIPEPKVVERVVEKIVEKPVERVVEKVVEKVIDNSTYTDLQKKAAEWANDESIAVNALHEFEFYKKALDIIISSNSISNLVDNRMVDIMNYVDSRYREEYGPEFCLTWALKYFYTSSIYFYSLFSDYSLPNYDLTISCGSRSGEINVDSLFNNSTFKSITLNIFSGTYIAGSIPLELSEYNFSLDKLLTEFTNSIFQETVAEKVTFNISSYKLYTGWNLLSNIGQSLVDTFEICDSTGSGQILDISTIVDKVLADVSQDEHKPKLIFRDFIGEATEELKQKVLDKGYLSVEFYKGDTKVL